MNEPLATAKTLRKQCKKHKEKEPCFICGKHSTITECHHVIPLKICADIMNEFHKNELTVPTAWLCPNCHAYAHIIFDNPKRPTSDFFNALHKGDVTEEEFEAFEKISDIQKEFYSKLFKE